VNQQAGSALHAGADHLPQLISDHAR